jgi:hypothetical protein
VKPVIKTDIMVFIGIKRHNVTHTDQYFTVSESLKLILTISHVEIKGKISKLQIKIYTGHTSGIWSLYGSNLSGKIKLAPS